MSLLVGSNIVTAMLTALIIGSTVHGCQQDKLDTLAAEYNQFKGGVAAAGLAQNQASAAAEVAAIKRKERADESHAKKSAADRSTIAALRLRINAERDSRGGFVPDAPAGSRCPDGQACFDRADLERAVRELTAGVRRLADEGAEVERELNTAKEWAQR